MTIKERVEMYCRYKTKNGERLSVRSFCIKAGLANGYFKDSLKSIGEDKATLIEKAFPDLDLLWLEKGVGDMIKSGHAQHKDDNTDIASNRQLIPFYDDVATIGGTDMTADVDTAHSRPTEFIDAGDWFRDATAAIRHYGKSMIEYPSGCILALKEVQDRELIIPGRDYTIETSEYRVTKRLQKGKTREYITAYSTNLEMYPDGRMIHEPFDIPWNSIRRIYAVLGYVVKKNGGTFVFSNNKK